PGYAIANEQHNQQLSSSFSNKKIHLLRACLQFDRYMSKLLLRSSSQVRPCISPRRQVIITGVNLNRRRPYPCRISYLSTDNDGPPVMIGKGEKLWEPTRDQILSSQMTAFAKMASDRAGKDLTSYTDLHRWSTSQVGPFWEAVSDFCGVKWTERWAGQVYSPPTGGSMRGAVWFEGARLNFAKNLLPPPTDAEVLISISERPELPTRRLSGRDLHTLVARCVRALRRAGVGRGDRVAGVMVNSQDAIVCMLGTTSIGAIWSSCSPDFGVQGVVDRLGQISPRVVFFSLGYSYGGRWHDCRQQAREVLRLLPGEM
ncbi:unnamed protein product, partial [Discosporangium mesarthrocarpum]